MLSIVDIKTKDTCFTTMMSRSAQSQLSVWSSTGNPAKFVQSSSYKLSYKNYASGLHDDLPEPVAVPVVNSVCKFNHFVRQYHPLSPTDLVESQLNFDSETKYILDNGTSYRSEISKHHETYAHGVEDQTQNGGNREYVDLLGGR